jgi:hypothetical protein
LNLRQRQACQARLLDKGDGFTNALCYDCHDVKSSQLVRKKANFDGNHKPITVDNAVSNRRRTVNITFTPSALKFNPFRK